MEHNQLTVSDEMAELMGQKFKLDTVDEYGKTIPSTEDDQTDEEKQAAADAAAAAEEAEKSKTGSSSTTDDDDDDSTEVSPIEYLLEEYGLADDEDFKGFDLKDGSVENIKNFYTKREEIIKRQVEQDLLQSDEDLKSLAEWKKAGKSVASWKATQEAENFNYEIAKDDIEGQEKVVRGHYKDMGLSEKRINALIEQAKDDDELFSEAEKIIAGVKETLKTNAANRAKQEEAANAAAIKEQEANVKMLSDIIKEGKLDNRLVIPEKERGDFNKYIFSKAREEKWAKITPQQELLMEYMLFKDFEIKGVEKKTPVIANVENRRARLANAGGDDDTTEIMSFEELKARTKPRTT